jgi:hypothetical protein
MWSGLLQTIHRRQISFYEGQGATWLALEQGQVTDTLGFCFKLIDDKQRDEP